MAAVLRDAAGRGDGFGCENAADACLYPEREEIPAQVGLPS